MLAQVGLYSCEGLDLKFAFRRFDFYFSFERCCIVSSRGDHPLEIWATKAEKAVKRQRKDFFGFQRVRGTHR